MSDVVVIGAGIAGLTAANHLVGHGAKVTLVTKGIGGLQLGQGTVDILGYAPERVEQPYAAMDAYVQAHPEHPYAVIGADAVRRGVEVFGGLVDGLLTGDAETNRLFPTAVGAMRPTTLVQPTMVAGECVAGKRYCIVGFSRLKDFQASLIAQNLARTPVAGGSVDARSVVIDVVARQGEADTSGLTFARSLDDPANRKRLVLSLKGVVGHDEVVGLPAVLGLNDPGAFDDIAQQLGRPIFEIPLPPPSVPGMRLNQHLTDKAKQARVRFILGSRVIGHKGADGHLSSVTLSTAGHATEVTGDSFILAAGGFESGALLLDSYGKVSETIFGLPLVGADNPDLIHGDYWGPDQPLFKVGVAVDASMRVLRSATGHGDGEPVYDNLYAAGGVLAGATRWRDLSGEGIALGSAVRACDAILQGNGGAA